MRHRVDTLTYEVQPILVSVAVEDFEFEGPLEKKSVRDDQLFLRDNVLMGYSDCPDEEAKVRVV